jgi:gamma-glutamyltranspeptidase/glutathione hydrolase
VGKSILQAGGNAFDAAVAIAAALNVAEPMMSGVGGYGTILIYHAARNQVRFLNSSGRIPRAVESDAFRSPTPHYEANRRGAKAVSTPGNLHAWQAMSETYGRLPWSTLLQPAIQLAQVGFSIRPRLAHFMAQAFADFSDEARGIYGQNGRPLQTGDTLRQHNLAQSLAHIAQDGVAAFYDGPIGQAIHRTMQQQGGFLSLADLQADEAEWWSPINIPYRDCHIFVPSPPATSFPALIRLGMMSQLDVAGLGHNSADTLHYFAEITKHAFWCRLRYAGDPEIAPPPLDKLLSADYWQEMVAQIDPGQARPFTPPTPLGESSQHTTHFVVADSEGNIVSATQTIGQIFGSRIMPPGTGIWLNNSLQYCTFEPKGNPMDAHAGRRKLSGDCPAIVMKNGRPWIALGTPGGHTIAQTVPQILINLIDFGFDIQQAIAAPRISFVEPDELLVEDTIPHETQQILAARGHRLKITSVGIGNAHGLTIEYDENGRPAHFTGAADPRGDGLAAK